MKFQRGIFFELCAIYEIIRLTGPAYEATGSTNDEVVSRRSAIAVLFAGGTANYEQHGTKYGSKRFHTRYFTAITLLKLLYYLHFTSGW